MRPSDTRIRPASTAGSSWGFAGASSAASTSAESAASGRRHEERVACPLWQPGETVREQIAEARAEREGLAGRPLVAPSIHRAGDLECEERVAARGP